MLPRAEIFREWRVAAAVLAILATWCLRSWLESRMTLHMLVQLPLIALAGAALGAAWLRASPAGPAGRALSVIEPFNSGGATGLIAAGFVMVLWMLPRCLDTARLDAVADALKFLTVPAAGLAIAVSWPRLPAIARAVIHLEAIATLLRFGWGYLAAEDRLCLAYLAGDQQATGKLLLWLAAAYALAIVWRPMFGTIGRGARGGAREQSCA